MIKKDKKSLISPKEKLKREKGFFSSTMSKTLGVAVGILIIICSLVAIIYIIILVHDKYLITRYENPPSYSIDNQWGGLGVNIVITKKEIRDPIAPKARDCNSAEEKASRQSLMNFIGFAPLPCVQGELYGGFSGSVYLEGTINVRNDLWMDTKIIPSNLLTFNHGGRQVKPKLDKNIFGQYLNHGQGTSAKFSFEESYDAKDFQLYLNDLKKSALIVGDTVEPGHK